MVANLVLILPRGLFFFGFEANFMPLGEIEDPTALRTSSSKSKSSIKKKGKKKGNKKEKKGGHLKLTLL